MSTAAIAPKLVFYADDFTGASDNLAQFHRHGLRAVLLFGPPDEARLQALHERGGAEVVGVAGVARALPTGAMADEIDPAIEALGRLGAPLFQYKCCSTLDSSAAIGSLGEALRRMLRRWPTRPVAVLAAMPEFGRHTVFGNHFARFGDTMFRLDRHPVMSRHPSTPMHEADIGRLLAAQGLGGGSAVHVDAIDRAADAASLSGAIDWAAGPAIFDSCSNEQLVKAAGAIWRRAQDGGAIALAAQGLAHGLGQYLRASGAVQRPSPVHALSPVERVLVLSGSCSPLTATQIELAEGAGWHSEALDPVRWLADGAADGASHATVTGDAGAIGDRLARAMAGQGGAIAYSARGPDDPALARVRAVMQARQLPPERLAGAIGNACAAILRRVLAQGGARPRVVVAGGDSSSYTMRALGAWGLEVAASSFADNAHVCRLLADDPRVDGLEVLLKGGQVGRPDVLTRMRSGF